MTLVQQPFQFGGRLSEYGTRTDHADHRTGDVLGMDLGHRDINVRGSR